MNDYMAYGQDHHVTRREAAQPAEPWPQTHVHYLAKCDCGGVVASSDGSYERAKQNSQFCREMLGKGFSVQRVEVPIGTPMPAWCRCDRKSHSTAKGGAA